MSEIAFVSARKVRLEASVRKGHKNAQKALELAKSPDRFLSTVQIGITLIGIFTGIYSGENFSSKLDTVFERIAFIRPYAHTLSVTLIVIATTYLTLVLGELVPKRLGLSSPESVARATVRPMIFMSKIAAPFIWLLTVSTNFVLRVLNIKPKKEKVTEEEIRAIVKEGTEGGEVQEVEQDIVNRVFYLGDRKMASLTTHRSDLSWIDVNDSREVVKSKVMKNMHRVYPVSNKSLDEIEGVVFLKELFGNIDDSSFKLSDYTHKANFMHENMTVYNALAQFKTSKVRYAVVTNEFGSITGIVTMNDILEALVGDVEEPYRADSFIPQADGSILFDGQYPFYDFLNHYGKQELYSQHPFNTISGLLLEYFQHIPKEGELFKWMYFEFRIAKMDSARIDKVAVKYAEKAKREDD